MSMNLDPALLIPVVGAGILVYLAVLPLLMLFVGSFQAEVAPREFVYTLKNYHAAYASEHTYSTFLNSLIFASGSPGSVSCSAPCSPGSPSGPIRHCEIFLCLSPWCR